MAKDWREIEFVSAALILAIAVAAAIAFWPLAGAVIIAASLAVVLMPLQRRLSRLMPEALSAAVITAGVIAILLAILAFAAAVIYQNRQLLFDVITGVLEVIRELPEADLPFDLPDPGQYLDIAATEIGQAVGQVVFTWAPDAPTLVFQAFVLFLALFMLVLSGDRIAAEILSTLPERSLRPINILTKTMSDTFYSIYVVHAGTAVITFFFAIPFFYVLGYGHIVFFATITAIFQLIPIIGPGTLMTLLAFYTLLMGDIRGLLLVVLIGLPIVNEVPDLVFRPVLMGQRIRIHPVLLAIGFIGGIAAMGAIGFILGPLFIALGISGYRILIDELSGGSLQQAR
ncbi:MAG: AI-2E family transporter [Methanomicrobiaceae archaeon]|nr:AI-2E family transporter [Methanomicrobiaceae archaeon]MDD5418751.1 AI-2E family transporter [Methanomicrobiaceae archaeon]